LGCGRMNELILVKTHYDFSVSLIKVVRPVGSLSSRIFEIARSKGR
jgi:hypothetical protein